ncbi:hypothetical protein ACPWR0_03695 [Pandoraea pneumonica]|uniref:hypothetical protein n=1 Tax=Pandoraea pneumonica TaxID=2508299 RepID=UPI003CF02B1C
MFRRWLPLWLVVCLLVSQAALARHVVTHTAAALGISAADSPGNERHDKLHEDGVCEECLAFVAVDVALTSLPVVPPIAAIRDWHYPPTPPVHARSVSPGPTRNRDPPALCVLFD